MHCLSVVFANKKERDAMWAFVQQFDWIGLGQSEHSSHCVAPQRGEDLGLGSMAGRKVIGFAAAEPPQWTWAVAAWMAVQSSHRVHQWAVVLYDHDEIPVVVDTRAQDVPGVLVVTPDHQLRVWHDRALPTGPDHQAQQSFVAALAARWQQHSTR